MANGIEQWRLFAALLLAGAALAQQARAEAAGASLSLRQAVAQAVLRNPNRVRAAHEVAAAGYERDAAQWGRYPSVSVDAGAGQASGTLVPTTTVRVEQPLWAGGRIEGRIDAARALVSAAELAEAEARRRLAEETAVAYLAWTHAAERIEIARTGADALSRLVRYVRRREEEGLASPSDVSIASARHGSALAAVEETRGALDQARAQLEALMATPVAPGTEPGRGVAFTVPAYPDRALPDTEADYLASSQLVAQRRAEVESARAQAAVRRGAMLPRLALRLEHLSYQHQNPVAPANDSRALFVFQFSPDAGLGSYSGYQSAQSRIDSALAQLAADENDTRLRARANWAEHRASRRQVEQLEPLVAALDNATGSFMRQFEAGRKSWLEVLNTQREVLDARLALSRARTVRDQSGLRLMVNTGSFWTWLETLPQ